MDRAAKLGNVGRTGKPTTTPRDHLATGATLPTIIQMDRLLTRTTQSLAVKFATSASLQKKTGVLQTWFST